MQPIPHIPRRSRIAAVVRRLAGSDPGLHRCVACWSPFVCPVEWETDGPDFWLIQLHCGECDVWRDVRASNAEAKAFDLVLDRQMAQIQRALAELDRERMQAQADVFSAALAHDLIDPADFARS
jgi:hypothetical protein